MLTVGVDLAAEPVNTAVARISWSAGSAEISELLVGADDAVLLDRIMPADKVGIDCPLGWPQRFVEFVAQHQADAFVAPIDIAGRDWRRLLANRETDLVTREVVGLVPLSVAADRIGLTAMRCAGLLARLAAEGRPVDRSGAAVVVEVYPAAALKHWGLPFRRYKGALNAGVRDELVDQLAAAAPWLRFGARERARWRVDAGATRPPARSSDDRAPVTVLRRRGATRRLVTAYPPAYAKRLRCLVKSNLLLARVRPVRQAHCVPCRASLLGSSCDAWRATPSVWSSVSRCR